MVSKQKIGCAATLTWLASIVLLTGCDGTRSNQEQLSEAQLIRNTGLELLDQNRYEEAETEFKKLIELAPDEVIGYANLGIVYLRQDKLSEAESYFNQALELDPENVTVRLNLFDVYERLDDKQQAESQLAKVLEYDPENLFALYKMSQGSLDPDTGSMTNLDQYLLKIIEVSPGNIVPRVYLIEFLLERGLVDQAIEQFEDIQSKFERLPPETEEMYNQAYEHLKNSEIEGANKAMIMFHNQLKMTGWYQADIRALQGSEDSRIGIPIISFSRKMVGFGGDEENLVYQNVVFTDVTENAALVRRATNGNTNSFIQVHDFDNDGDQDLLYGKSSTNAERSLYLYSNELGRFQDVSNHSGLDDHKLSQRATFSDFDNDGFLDLFLIDDGSVKLYHNVNEMEYRDVTSESGLEGINNGICTLHFDADHDGDLDLFVGTTGPDRLFQNNGNGSFTDISSKAGIENSSSYTHGAVIGDFDDDGDLDFFVASENGNKLYSNTRMGTFQEATSLFGLEPTAASTYVSVGDYQNDGYIDLFISNHSGQYKFYKNQEGNGFVEEAVLPMGSISRFKPNGHAFFDYDNDGFQDLIIAGEPGDGKGRGIILLHNDQQGSFQDVSSSLPEMLSPVESFTIADYNEDSDLDIFVTFNDGNIGLLRNDGGNMNYQLKIQLVGLREGSGKNNYYGIGSKVEIIAGPRYQMRTINSPSEYFGLGSNERADILRIRWTNGVPQNIFSPHSDLDLIEQQRLKGSCPFLYTWNGEQYVFVKDMMWRSALGMPLGIMTSDHFRAYAFSEASREYLKIPGEMLAAKDYKYQLKITGELWETIYLDELALYAIDHPTNIDFALDEKFVPPPFPELKLYPIKQKHLPLSVTDGTTDMLDGIAVKDNDYISSFQRTKFQGITQLHDLIIDLGQGIPTDKLHLFLNGWIFPSDASINVAVGQSGGIAVVPPYLQVLNEAGEWETAIENLGFPLGKNKTVITDLSDVFKTNDRKIRIRTSMQIYWDHIYYAHVNQPFEARVRALSRSSASLHYRGFSAEFRKGGRNGPHWFDYSQVTKDPQWMDLEGYYTRYGDVTPLLDSADNQYIIYNAGDEVSISYVIDGLPEVPDGWTRDFVIYSVGWVKDGDLNTAYGQTVEPLPFHGMPSYPYPENYQYPFDENEEFLKKYNTRYVSPEAYRDKLKGVNP